MIDVKYQRGFWGDFFELFGLKSAKSVFSKIFGQKVQVANMIRVMRTAALQYVHPTPALVIAPQCGPPLAGSRF
jgi:hypothetical protein